MIAYLIGDATRPVGTGPRVISHVCNDRGAWGAGFVMAISARWRAPEAKYRAAFLAADRPQLGDVQFCSVDAGPVFVANMIAQGLGGVRPLVNAALSVCLAKVAVFCRDTGASLHMPRIGCGLAGGRWEEVEPIIRGACEGVAVHIYDLPTTGSRS